MEEKGGIIMNCELASIFDEIDVMLEARGYIVEKLVVKNRKTGDAIDAMPYYAYEEDDDDAQ